MPFIDKMTAIEADAVYCDGALAGSDYTVTLPDVVPVTIEGSGLMGTMNIPTLTRFESLELTVTKQGVDANAARMCTPGKKDIMVNWVQNRMDSSGNLSPVGCKAQIGGLPKKYMPSASVEVGSTSEFDCTYEVYEYKLTIDGVLVFHVNRIAGILKAWNGGSLVDYSSKYSNLL